MYHIITTRTYHGITEEYEIASAETVAEAVAVAKEEQHRIERDAEQHECVEIRQYADDTHTDYDTISWR